MSDKLEAAEAKLEKAVAVYREKPTPKNKDAYREASDNLSTLRANERSSTKEN